MSPMSPCQCCYGGGIALIHQITGVVDAVACEECGGTGLVSCHRCNDSGWMPVMDVYGEYAHDEPCTCYLGAYLMHATPTTDDAYDVVF